MYYRQLYESPLGPLFLLASDHGLRGIWFEGQVHFQRGVTSPFSEEDHPLLDQTCLWLDAYFLGRTAFPPVPLLDIQGTPFQKRVWSLLCQIPYSQTASYKDLAQRLGVVSAQAVGGAVGRNPFSILIPCHRVVGHKGQLTGYAGGIEKKIWLLQHEQRNRR